jgi:hypothetical protein
MISRTEHNITEHRHRLDGEIKDTFSNVMEEESTPNAPDAPDVPGVVDEIVSPLPYGHSTFTVRYGCFRTALTLA